MLQTIEELLGVVERHPAAVRVLIFTAITLLAGGAAIWYRIRGSRVRAAMQEWDLLFSDLNGRVVSLYRELDDVRSKLNKAESRLSEALHAAKKAQEVSQDQFAEIQRLKALVQELRQKEAGLIHEKKNLMHQIKTLEEE